MAEHAHSGPAELGAPMDYAEHQRTFAGFVTLTKITILAAAITLIALALYGFGAGGFWFGSILVLLMIVGAAISIVAKGSIKPLVAVLIVGVIFFVLSVG
jgi:hypothetical protein